MLQQISLNLRKSVRDFFGLDANPVDLELGKVGFLNSETAAAKLREKILSVEKERDQIKTIVSAAAEGIIVIDQEGQLSLINPVAERMLQISFANAQGKKIEQLYGVKVRDQQIDLGKRPEYQAFETRKIIRFSIEDDFYIQTTSGMTFPASINVSPLVEEDRVTGAVVVFDDISKEKLAKEQIEQEVQKRTFELKNAQVSLEARTTELEKLKSGLEISVAERTEELKNKVTELERTNKSMIDRELKMIELKKEIEELKESNK